MIDEQKLIDDFREQIKRSTSPWTHYGNVIKTVAEQPRIGEWIPCSERLPEESLNSVIGWDEYRERCCFVQYYNGEWILGDYEAVKIIAWMPIPEPYKEGGNKNGRCEMDKDHNGCV